MALTNWCLGLGMRRSLSYVDAVKMLGGGENALVKVLDRVSAVGLLAVPGFNLAGTCRIMTTPFTLKQHSACSFRLLSTVPHHPQPFSPSRKPRTSQGPAMHS
jgi:hypothetical protein